MLVSVLDRRVVVVDEVVLHVLQGEGGLAHTAVTKHHYPIPGRWFDCNNLILVIVGVMFDKDDDDGQKPPQSRIPEVTVDDDDVDNDDGDDDDDETS